MTDQVEQRAACGHKLTVENTTYSCILRRNHEGRHYDSFVAYNDLGEVGPVDDVVKRERAMVERAIAGKATPNDVEPSALVHKLDESGGIVGSRRVGLGTNGTTRRRRATAPPSSYLAPDTYPPPEAAEGEPAKAGLVQGEAVRVVLRNVVAFDHKNPRQMPLVEEARRLLVANVAHTQNPTYCDLIERVADLYSSIPTVGLIEPIVVEPLEDGRWELKAGWRRMTALLLLYGETCETVAMLSAVDKKKSRLASLAENVSRKDMPWHLQASSFADLQKEYSTKELSDGTGVSISSINNLTRVRNKLHPKIWEVVCKWGGTPRAVKIEPMLRLAAKDPEEQLLLWQQMTEGNGGKPLPQSSGPDAKPVIDPSDLLMQRQPETILRAMTEAETKDFLAVLRQAFSTHDGWPKDMETRRAYRFALGALEAVTGQQTQHTEMLREELAKTRTLGETIAKEAQGKGAKGTTPVTVARRGAAKVEPAKARRQRDAKTQPPKGGRKTPNVADATKKAAPVGKGARHGSK